VLPELLAARDARYDLRRRFAAGARSLVEVTLNVPGWPKVSPALRAVFDWGLAEVERTIPTTRLHEGEDAAGYFALYEGVAPGPELKARAVEIEQREPWGRLLDIDCYEDTRKVSRRALGAPERRCLLCADSHEICIGERRHAPEALREAVETLAAACAARSGKEQRGR
jgi:holo-ACP synthase CitX